MSPHRRAGEDEVGRRCWGGSVVVVMVMMMVGYSFTVGRAPSSRLCAIGSVFTQEPAIRVLLDSLLNQLRLMSKLGAEGTGLGRSRLE